MPPHHSRVALLGDSIFDNASYTRGEPDVVTHLRQVLPSGWDATLYAVDGATTAGIVAQAARVAPEVTHVVVSVGGNDALQSSDLLSLRVASAAQALDAFASRVALFETEYGQALARVTALGRPTFVCTVYNGALEPAIAGAARMGLTLFNDVIVRSASALGLDILDLRAVCTERSDYANPIEPSGRGGLKIARAIARMIGAVPDAGAPARLWR
jgi:lysophospholipase L1-like esterase